MEDSADGTVFLFVCPDGEARDLAEAAQLFDADGAEVVLVTDHPFAHVARKSLAALFPRAASVIVRYADGSPMFGYRRNA